MRMEPDKNFKNEIDYFLFSDLSTVKDVSLKKELNFPTDHRAIRLKLEIQKRIHIKNYGKWLSNLRFADDVALFAHRKSSKNGFGLGRK